MTEQDLINVVNETSCCLAHDLLRGLVIMDNETLELQLTAIAATKQLLEVLAGRTEVAVRPEEN